MKEGAPMTRRLFATSLAAMSLLLAAAAVRAADSPDAAAMPLWSQRYGGPLRDDQIEDITS